jgi:hypothetical protein
VHNEERFDVIRGENPSAQTLSRRDGFRLSQKQIYAGTLQAQVFYQYARAHSFYPHSLSIEVD